MTQANNRRAGFTLIELLVTISIIAIIASLSFVSVSYLMTKAKVEKTRIFVNAATRCCDDFKQKYRQHPFGAPEESATLNSKMKDGGWLELSPMRADLSGVVQINKQKIEFISLPTGFVAPGGAVVDPWGQEIQSQ